MRESFYMVRGQALMNQGKYDHAIPDFNEELNSRAFETDCYYLRGWCHYSIKKYEEAEVDAALSIFLALSQWVE